jgi:chromosome partitioning protein
MRTIAVISQKGGSGKTTLAVHLAASYALAGLKTVLLDLDPQASATEWKDARASETPAVEPVVPARLGKVIETARTMGVEILILDTAPHAEATALEAARNADLILVPCRPSIMDLRALRKTVDLLQLARVEAFGVLNGVEPRGSEADEAAEMISDQIGLRMCPVRFGDRVAFARCLIDGLTVMETEPGGKAAEEAVRLYEWTRAQIEPA